MVTIESTPEMAAKVYATMAKNLKVVRRRLGKALTLADKVLLGHLDDPETQEMIPGKSYLFLRPDRVVFQDVLGQTGLLQFMQTRRDKVAVATAIPADTIRRIARELAHAAFEQQVTLDLPWTDTTVTPNVTYNSGQIRKVNIHVGVRSEVISKPNQDYVRIHISTSVDVRSLASVDRYK